MDGTRNIVFRSGPWAVLIPVGLKRFIYPLLGAAIFNRKDAGRSGLIGVG